MLSWKWDFRRENRENDNEEGRILVSKLAISHISLCQQFPDLIFDKVSWSNTEVINTM